MFGKKEMNLQEAEKFWNWFEENEDWIKVNLKIRGLAVVEAVDEKLKPVFPYWKKELEFQLGYNEGQGEIFFFHFNNRNLVRDAEKLESLMPQTLKKTWRFIAEA